MPGMQYLVALCHELQRHAGDGTFFLSCRKAGEVLGVDPKTAWRWLFLLTREEVLKLVKKGTRASKQASEFRYLEPLEDGDACDGEEVGDEW